jgi:hypothetical protein
MADGVLYFPHINVPSEAWFTQALLYWDTVGCIIPATYRPQAHHRSTDYRRTTPTERWEYTEKLIDSGLVTPVRPEPERGIPEFVTAFLARLDSDPEIAAAADAATLPTAVPVHRGKLGMWLVSELVRRGLAWEGADDMALWSRTRGRDVGGDWVPIEPRTAAFFMVALADYLGRRHRPELTPLTQQPEMLNVYGDLLSPAAARVRRLVLEDVLPVPERPPDPAALARFKERRGSELGRFRRRIESAVRDIVRAGRDEEDARVREFLDDARAEVDEIVEMIQEERWAGLRRLALSVTAAAGDVAVTAMTGSATVAAVGAVPALLVALSDASSGGQADRLAFAYAAAVRRTWPVQS